MKLIECKVFEFDDKELILRKYKSLYISKKILSIIREKLIPDILLEATKYNNENSNKTNAKTFLKSLNRCKPEYPICLALLSKHIYRNKLTDNFVMKTEEKIEVFNDYLEFEVKKFSRIECEVEGIPDLIIVRSDHICKQILKKNASKLESMLEMSKKDAEFKSDKKKKSLLLRNSLVPSPFHHAKSEGNKNSEGFSSTLNISETSVKDDEARFYTNFDASDDSDEEQGNRSWNRLEKTGKLESTASIYSDDYNASSTEDSKMKNLGKSLKHFSGYLFSLDLAKKLAVI